MLNCSTVYAKGKPVQLSDEQRKELNQRCQKLADELDAADDRIAGLEDRLETFRKTEQILRDLVHLGNEKELNLKALNDTAKRQIESLTRELELEKQLRANHEKELTEVKEKLKSARSARNRTLIIIGTVGFVFGVLLGVGTAKD